MQCLGRQSGVKYVTGFQQGRDVDARGETHAFEHEHQVLGYHVAGGAGGVRAATQAGQAGVGYGTMLLQLLNKNMFSNK